MMGRDAMTEPDRKKLAAMSKPKRRAYRERLLRVLARSRVFGRGRLEEIVRTLSEER